MGCRFRPSALGAGCWGVRDRVGGEGNGLAPEEPLALGGPHLEWVRRSIHDLCQPLTALQLLLYMGLAERVGDKAEAAEVVGLRKTLDEAIVECDKLVSLVRSMQQRTTDRNEDGSFG